jgi:septum formation protein
MTNSPFILASTSLTRRRLLQHAGLVFETMSSGIDENTLVAANPQWQSYDIALELAKAKCLAVSLCHHDTLVIGADQTQHLGDELIAAPETRAQARSSLQRLRGQTHILRSSVVLARHGQILWHTTDEARIKMRNFSDHFLDHYVATAEPEVLLSAGSYRLEECGVQLFEKISGDYFTILGLPLLPLLKNLREHGVITS